MSDPFNNRNMPTGLLVAVSCLLGFTLLAVAAFSTLRGPAPRSTKRKSRLIAPP